MSEYDPDGLLAAADYFDKISKEQPKYANQNPFDKLHEGEPWFFLRAQDELSYSLLWAYKDLCDTYKLPQQAASIQALMDKFKFWQEANRARVKLPD